MTEKKKVVLAAWRITATHPLPTTHGTVIEAHTAHTDIEGLPPVLLTYDARWGNGRGCWFPENGTAFSTARIHRWRPYKVVQAKEA